MDKKDVLSKKELIKIKSIRNRESEIIPFNVGKIVEAVLKAFTATSEGGEKEAQNVANKIFRKLVRIKDENGGKKFIPNVEMVQDLVEAELMDLGFYHT